MFKIGTFGFRCWIFLPILTFLVSLSLEINPARGENVGLKQQQEQVESTDNSTRSSLEPEILAEINRARTNPQGYAAWLEEQKQYYNGVLLKLPGEKTVRTNKGLRALVEAIDFLEQQESLPNLTISEQLTATATSQLTQIAAPQAGKNFKNISYGKVTASGIVMHLVVDDGFPDRRHRASIFNPNFSLAGIICQEDELYDNVCAIAYEQDSTSELDITAETLPQAPQSDSSPDVKITSESTNTVVSTAHNSQDKNKSDPENNDLPAVPELEVPNLAAPPEPKVESEAVNEDNNSSAVAVTYLEDKPESTLENVPQSDSEILFDNTPLTANLLEKTKRGALEEGDDTIPNDGSFYDSYPLEGNAGDSFIITLESQEFDTFIAIMDSEGNILDQNDDINDNNSNSRLRVTLPDDGVYNIIVNAYDKGGQGRYTLTVRR